MTFKLPHLIGYDWDHTLCDSYTESKDPAAEAFETAVSKMQKQGYQPTERPEVHSSAISNRGLDALSKLSILFNASLEHQELVRRYYLDTYIDIFPLYAELIDGAENIIELHAAKGLPFFIASDSPQEIIKAQFFHFYGDIIPNISRFAVFGSLQSANGQRLTKTKPSPDIILESKNLFRIPENANVWYVGDSFEKDVHAAIKAKFQPIWLDRNNMLGSISENDLDIAYEKGLLVFDDCKQFYSELHYRLG